MKRRLGWDLSRIDQPRLRLPNMPTRGWLRFSCRSDVLTAA